MDYCHCKFGILLVSTAHHCILHAYVYPIEAGQPFAHHYKVFAFAKFML